MQLIKFSILAIEYINIRSVKKIEPLRYSPILRDRIDRKTEKRNENKGGRPYGIVLPAISLML